MDALLDLPSHLRERLAGALKAGFLATPWSAASLRAVLGHAEGIDEIATALVELDALGISGPAAAAWIGSIERVRDIAGREGAGRPGRRPRPAPGYLLAPRPVGRHVEDVAGQHPYM